MSDWLHKLVLVRSDPRMFGKVVAERGDTVDIEFFRSVADRETLSFPKRDILHLALPEQTRVFTEIAGIGWRVGRAMEACQLVPGTYTYSVQFPNAVVTEITEIDCFIRCLDRYADPARILLAGCMETQFFADRRRTALAALRRLRTAAQGLTGVVSAPIELVPHQLATVRRVVTDRHQRYLLADEVGLGKTIEAGLIIRQLLLDSPRLQVQVWVPAVLESQWRGELERRCGLNVNGKPVVPRRAAGASRDSLRCAPVALRTHEDLNDFDWADVPDLLVIDEAHRLIVAADGGERATFHQRVRETALRARRLLLLSATPALGEEAQLLALLTLLDPAAYAEVPLEEFRRRVADRQLIGRLLLAMRAGTAPFVLGQQAKRALEMFADDPVVKTEAARVLAATTGARQELDAATVALSDHIANTYRIHQRIIRARRVDVERWTMMPRGPASPALTHVRLFFSSDGYARNLRAALDGWRHGAHLACAGDESLAAGLAERWGHLVEAAWCGAACLAKVAQTTRRKPLFAGEDSDLAELQRTAQSWIGNEDRYTAAESTLRDWLRELPAGKGGRLEKLVCFSTDPEDARHLAEHLSRSLGSGKVRSLAAVKEIGTAVSDFASSKTAQILVCDRSTEEGLNLQFAHGILHMDLPLDAARVEQRIGRLDRFGRRAAQVEHRIFLPDDEDDSPWQCWFAVLTNGLQIFNRSISDVQFQVNPLQRAAVLQLFTGGAYGLVALQESLAEKINAERVKLDEQHALDSLSDLLETGAEIRQAIETAETDETALGNAVQPWIRDVLGLTMDPANPKPAATLQFSWSQEALLPALPWKHEFEPAMRQRWTWSRSHSLRNGSRPAFLLRPGSDFTEVLERVALWDDRGIAYATWRVEPGWEGRSRAFRLVWLVEPALETDTPVYIPRRASEMARRAEALLPPFTVEHYMDEHGETLDNPAVLEVLARPYTREPTSAGQYDLNLGSRPEGLREAIDWTQFVARTEAALVRARQNLEQMPAVADRLQAATRACELDSSQARRLLDVRRTLAKKFPDRVERPQPQEAADLETLRRAIATPNIRLDEIGFWVISSTAPET